MGGNVRSAFNKPHLSGWLCAPSLSVNQQRSIHEYALPQTPPITETAGTMNRGERVCHELPGYGLQVLAGIRTGGPDLLGFSK